MEIFTQQQQQKLLQFTFFVFFYIFNSIWFDLFLRFDSYDCVVRNTLRTTAKPDYEYLFQLEKIRVETYGVWKSVLTLMVWR